jgi:two-component system, NarL family, nitrate/nitrite response regulator NarL
MNTYQVAPAATGVPPREAIRIFIAEDHQITLWGLRQLVEASGRRMEVVGTACTPSELMNHDAIGDTDVILLDLDLGGEDMGAALGRLRERCPGHVLVITGADSVSTHRDVMLKGARGVIHKSEPAESILRALEKVSQGEIWLNRLLLGQVMGMLTNAEQRPAPREVDPEAARIDSLTGRERDIIAAMVRSSGAKQLAVASDLGISEHTLRNHLTTIYSKLCVHGRLELHVYAVAHGLGTPAETPTRRAA